MVEVGGEVERKEMELEAEGEGKDKQRVVILTFVDPTDTSIKSTFVVTTTFEEMRLQKVAEKLRDIYELTEYEDWSYRDIVDDMEKLSVLKVYDAFHYTVVI